ncbi:ethanolamine-phosphate cytidylyltransferase [Arachis duranensis]|uniref:ethanolamine-phosphate cytidylyltransferase n=1 Tax=Arachis duranensis TaxID=130453 RepID=A0A6P4DFS8_ARADU|nr:ethanolamine-phosphate cytidylyltransferase [Arachis duranensis]
MDYENNSWIWDGVYYYPHLFGGIMVTAALLGLSTSYFGGIGSFHKRKSGEKKRVRVYMDGCFDLVHYGHANALRQAKALGDELVVGVVNDEVIAEHKGPPVFNMEERLTLVNGLKWVDEVIPDAPYAISEEFMNRLFNEYKIDYIIHGDDPCLLPDGSDVYAAAKKAGRYKQIKRTEGVSSTDIVGRILASSRCRENGEDHIVNGKQHQEESQSEDSHISQFLPTSRRISQFSNGKEPGANARIVYIDGAFDLFHAGHVEILKRARELGDFLLVGIYSDETVREHRGSHYPIMRLHERSLSVLSCRYANEVIIGAPWKVTKDMITTFNISQVVHGTVAENSLKSESDPYEVPKNMGIFRLLESPKDTTTTSVAQRIIANHEAYKKRNAKKAQNEKRYYEEEKKYVSGE